MPESGEMLPRRVFALILANFLHLSLSLFLSLSLLLSPSLSLAVIFNTNRSNLTGRKNWQNARQKTCSFAINRPANSAELSPIIGSGTFLIKPMRDRSTGSRAREYEGHLGNLIFERTDKIAPTTGRRKIRLKPATNSGRGV